MKTTHSKLIERDPLRIVVLAVALRFFIHLSPAAWAQDASWTNVTGDSWSNGVNWSMGVAPSNNPNVWITNAGTKTVTIDDTTPSADLTVTNLYVSTLLGGGTNTLLLNNTAPLNVLGGMFVASNANSSGTVVINGGQLLMAMGTEVRVGGGVGDVGNIIVSNGTFQACSLYLGNTNKSLGKLTVAGGNSVVSNLYVGNSSSAFGTGMVVMTGGRLVTTNSTTLLGALINGSVGIMEVSNSTWLAQQVMVGYNARAPGFLTIESGGTNVLSGNLNVGWLAAANGTIVMTGGQLVTTNGNAIIGGNGIGRMAVSNGSWLAKNIYLGNANKGQGTLTIAGGSNVVSGMMSVGNAVGGTGVVIMTGGYLSAPMISLGFNTTAQGQGSFLLSGGVLETTNLVSGLSGSGAFTNQGGVLQFISSASTITANTINNIVVTNGTIAFRGVTNADVYANQTGSSLTNITFQGNNIFRLNNASNTFAAATQNYTFDMGLGATNYTGLELVNGNTAWQSAWLNIGSGGTMLASNTSASVAGVLSNSGTINVVNSRVIYGGAVVISGGYISDPSTNIYISNVTVTASGYLQGSNGDQYVFYRDLINQSTNRTPFNLSQVAMLFTNGNGVAATNHLFELTGSGAVDMGSNWLNVAQLATNFSIGTLSIAPSNRLTLMGTNFSSGITNALYVGWLDLETDLSSGTAVSNALSSMITLTNINLYYDTSDTRNAYLQDASYALWGSGGLLIPIPEPSTAGLILGGALFSAWLLRRKRNEK